MTDEYDPDTGENVLLKFAERSYTKPISSSSKEEYLTQQVAIHARIAADAVWDIDQVKDRVKELEGYLNDICKIVGTKSYDNLHDIIATKSY